MISGKTVARLSLYRRILHDLREDGERHIFSHQLAGMAGGTAAQVRRDMMAIGYSGSPTKGYDIKALAKSIGDFLDEPRGQKIALAGVGNLGQAILTHFPGRRPKLSIVAAFDVNPELIGRTIHGCRCYHVNELDRIVRERQVEVGILTVPARVAQRVAERMYAGGIRGLLNFTPVRLSLPEEIDVEDYDIAMCLEKVAFFARQHGRFGKPEL
ncbi:MAG TPA: redox-sensing transcriptional repressor Rex [Candidatus Hydrogenedentes bacterium]|nr:redox-sensing transcriptional repressor Rex [Candidatus Hydrogenedentota bacterium]HPG68890.1 redox-sensing transcriptional repressor Rex [Candidatus Hydrogenedentota bacterium]